jgi:Bifunctional DNA primase/polymerase, N-terminal
MTLATFSERERMLWTFPCGEDKKPRNANGFLGAVQGVWWPRAKLVGVPTGNRNGFDILDIDGSEGLRWYDRNYDAIPQTRAHSTQRGCHLLFVNAPGLRCSTGKIAPGVDVRAEHGYCIWWPRGLSNFRCAALGMAGLATCRGNEETAQGREPQHFSLFLTP